MVSPGIDHPDEPFCYFSKPTDEIGVMDAQVATEVTPEGYLYTGFGELMFFAGEPLKPIAQRVKTLEQGYLPVLHYTYRKDAIAYNFTMFAATLDGKPDGTLVDFVRVMIKNEGSQPARFDFASGMRYQNESNTGTGTGDNRYRRPVLGGRPGEYRQIGEDFNPEWKYEFKGQSFQRDGKAVYLFPLGEAERSLTLMQRYNDPPDLTPRKLSVLLTTPLGIVQYSNVLDPGSETTLDYKLPVVPISDPQDLSRVEAADFGKYLSQTQQFWKAITSQGMRITLPEEKVADTFKANLVYDLIARDKIGDNYIQTVNKLHYHSFYLRDSSDIVHSYDVTGYPVIAHQVLDFFAQSQQPDGNFLSQPEQYDGWGETLWAYGQHYRMTHDLEFAKQVYPQVQRAVAWLQQARKQDPLYIVPASDVKDNEYVAGHLTGYNFLALAGLDSAIALADAVGDQKDAAAFKAEYDDLHAAFFKVLDQRTAENGGYIPPALDGQKGGQDWGNLLGAYPVETLDPHDPKITATLKATQAKYQEGIMTYGDGRWLHHYLTIKNTLTEVERGDQEQVVRELYGLLMHTSATQAGFEFAIRPWGSRDFDGNLSPHGWFAAEYRTLLRNMLVREERKDLHLLSVISPEWIGEGKRIEVQNAPTEFGTVGFALDQPSESEATLRIDSHFTNPPDKLVVHLPWFMSTEDVSADGKPVVLSRNAAVVPAGTREVNIRWKHSQSVNYSYKKAVEDYKNEYAKKYEAYMHGAAR